jgi:hypothetical protein
MAPRVMRIPTGAASALGNKLVGQKKFNTTPSAIVAAKIKGGRVITSGLSGRLSCIAFSPVRRPPVTLWGLVRCRFHRRDLEGVYLIMMVPDRDIFAELERICAEPIARFVVVSGTFVVKRPTCMLRSTGLVNKAAILVLFAVPKSVDAAMLAVLLPEGRIDVASGVERSHELVAAGSLAGLLVGIGAPIELVT